MVTVLEDVELNNSKLKGRITEKGYTYQTLAPKLGLSNKTLSKKVNGTTDFTRKEIFHLIDILDIPDVDVCDYFFCRIS